MQKVAMPLPTHMATIVLPDFARSFPAGKKRCCSLLNNFTNQKEGKGTTEKRAGAKRL